MNPYHTHSFLSVPDIILCLLASEYRRIIPGDGIIATNGYPWVHSSVSKFILVLAAQLASYYHTGDALCPFQANTAFFLGDILDTQILPTRPPLCPHDHPFHRHPLRPHGLLPRAGKAPSGTADGITARMSADDIGQTQTWIPSKNLEEHT